MHLPCADACQARPQVATFERLLAYQLMLPEGLCTKAEMTSWQCGIRAAKIGATGVGIGALFAVTGAPAGAGRCSSVPNQLVNKGVAATKGVLKDSRRPSAQQYRWPGRCRDSGLLTLPVAPSCAGGLAAPAIAAGIGAAISLVGGAGAAAAAASASGFLATAAGTAATAAGVGVAGGSFAGSRMARRVGARLLLSSAGGCASAGDWTRAGTGSGKPCLVCWSHCSDCGKKQHFTWYLYVRIQECNCTNSG